MVQKKLVFHVPPGYVERLLPAFGSIITDFVCKLSGKDFYNLGSGLDGLREDGRQFSFSSSMNEDDGSFLVAFSFVDSTDDNGEKYLLKAMVNFEADLIPQN